MAPIAPEIGTVVPYYMVLPAADITGKEFL